VSDQRRSFGGLQKFIRPIKEHGIQGIEYRAGKRSAEIVLV
jgi:hypothetical protein